MSKKKGGFDSPLKITYLACETTTIMNLRCRGILINQYPLPGIMNLNTYWLQKVKNCCLLSLQVYTLLQVKSSYWYHFRKTFLLVAVVSILTTGMFPATGLLLNFTSITHFGGDAGIQKFVCGCVQCTTGVAQSWLIALGNKSFTRT